MVLARDFIQIKNEYICMVTMRGSTVALFICHFSAEF